MAKMQPRNLSGGRHNMPSEALSGNVSFENVVLRGVFQGEEEKSTRNGCPRIHRIRDGFLWFLKEVIRDKLMAGHTALSEFLIELLCWSHSPI